ncbi:ExeA family protein [Rhizobacter sp. Root404]|uniref:ExeA family protein n=1 Tax=Rhizobacter sp. Root404 TaxID=1736528 RepID=UPI0006FE0283|nr:ExeA family protein [Rhizobacter sp. Root404]KQW38183.1 peptidoglycan-binding protein [Rhizobacter sp. Root404]
MYAPFFGLKHEPFSIAPDPRYLFMSERHREALAHLLYGVNGGGGFVLLSGEIGAGKTTVCRCFLEQIPRRTNVAYIFNPKLTVPELLQSVCEEFGIPKPAPAHGGEPTVKDYLDPLNEFLLKTHAVGQNNVLIIDEAQMLSAEVLEQLRLLTNLETNERKLLQIILIGQPELRDLLARPELEQLAQRVIARYHLGALTEDETERYIRHRLSVAGMTVAMPFDAKSMQRIHELSRGVPRRINLLCDRALLGAYASGKGQVDRAIVDKAGAEVFDKEGAGLRAHLPANRRQFWNTAALVGAGAAVIALVVSFGWPRGESTAVTAAPSASAASAAARLATAGASAAASAAPADGAAQGFLTAAELPQRFKTLTRDERDAWRQLAPAWKVTLEDGEPCTVAQRSQLQCFRSANSTLALIRQLDRPGIVTLRDETDRPVYALLTGLGNDTATLRIGETAQTIKLVSLASLWRGDFATFWRVPAGMTGKVIDAGSGAPAAGVARQLAALNGLPVAASDSEWKSQVSAFQLAQGLKADGIAGPTTFMQLNRATGVDEPRLRGAAPTP